ncbi:MAG: hypothetical protein HYX47_20470 [Burkholderiales bacterium]|nr:hypothetical protein [Burkholderiales bacterium]
MEEVLSPQPRPDPLIAARRASTLDWLAEGIRAGVLLRPRVGGSQPTVRQMLLLLVALSLLEIGLARLEMRGTAGFDLKSWLGPQWGTAALVLLAWCVLPGTAGPDQPQGLAAWFALWMGAVLPANTVSQALGIAQAYELLPPLLATSAWAAWGVYFLLWAWSVAVAVRLASRFGATPARQGALALGLVAVFGLTAWQFPDRPWQGGEVAGAAEQAPRLELSQEVFEDQQALWRTTVDNLAPQRPGVTDVYGLVFAPYASEDVFLRESSMVARLLAERFDAKDRVIHLVNHISTTGSHPWATQLNLERAIAAIGKRMDLEHDVLVVYLTSHGASDYKLAAAHPPLEVDTVSPGELREALDKAGIRNRVIAVSACYSGGWLGPLANDTTLVMTAADATHTSYGCGRLSELTFFGRAVWDEQLRKTHSFEQAFAQGVPVIAQREKEAGKDDGFSNPQISVGEKIKPVLRELEQRLDAQPVKH